MWSLLSDLAGTANKGIKAAMASYRPGSTAGDLSSVILTHIKGWEPKYKNQPVLTPGLRVKLAGALGELAFNLAVIDAKG